MTSKIEITLDVIVHATEDISKVFHAFKDMLDLEKENFRIDETTGHYENPITMLNIKIVKKQAQDFIRKLFGSLSSEQACLLIEEIEERTINSRFHMRINKQELIKGNLRISDKDTIQLKIFTPIYNKKDTVKIFTEIFQIAN